MKIKTNITAGMTFEECDAQRNWWKQQANMMESYQYSTATTPPSGLWFPCMSNPPYPGSGSGSSSGNSGSSGSSTTGGYVAGVWVPDMSGVCV